MKTSRFGNDKSHYQMQIIMCWVTLYKEYRVGKYIRVNEAEITKKYKKK